MKRVFFALLFVLLWIVMMPNVYAIESVAIEKIEMVSKSDTTVIKSEPSFSGLEMNYDIAFKNPNDFVNYKITIKNNDEKDYDISNDLDFTNSDYIKYEYEVNDILKANDRVEVLLTISYAKQIDDSLYVDDKYVENNVNVIKLLTKKNDVSSGTIDNEVVQQNQSVDEKEEPITSESKQEEVNNPKTSTFNTIVFSILLVMFVISLVLFIKGNRYFKGLGIFILFIGIMIPIITTALEEIKLKTNVKVEIIKGYKVFYHHSMTKAYKVGSDKSEAEYCYDHIYYLGSVSEENKYEFCGFNGVYEEPKIFFPGDTVVVEKYLPDGDSCDEIEFNENYVLCRGDSFLESSSSANWQYEFINENNEEAEIMKFNNSAGFEIKYNDSLVTLLYDINRVDYYTFIMPAHDVHFYEVTL